MSITLAGIPAAFSTLVIGVGPLTHATDLVLRKKHTAMDRYWNQMFDRCLSEDKIEPDALRWLRSQQVAHASGKLCRERAQKLEAAGLAEGNAAETILSSISEERTSFTFSPRIGERLGYASVACACPAVLALCGAPLPSIVVGCCLGLVLTLILICDMRARIIPYQACIVYGAISLVWMLFTQSFYDALASMVLALSSAIVLALVERCAIRTTSASAIGAGDRRLIPLICLQIGTAGVLPGLVGLCVVAGTMAIKALIQGNSKRSYLPFAPALVAFALVGTVWPFLPLPW